MYKEHSKRKLYRGHYISRLYRKTGRMVDSFFPLHAANRDKKIEQLGRRKQF